MRVRILAALFLIAAVFAGPQGADKERSARNALIDRDYARAASLLGELLAERPKDERADYWALMRLRGLALAGDHQTAAAWGEAFLSRHPESRFLEKAAFLTARSLLLLGRGKEAGDLMAASLDRLKAPAARSWIAGYYLRAADAAYAGTPPEGPFDKGIAPDFARALKLYGLAREVGIPAAEGEQVLLRYALAALETKGFPLALEVVGDLKESPETLLIQGKAHLGLKSVPAARDAFERLVALAPDSKQAPQALFLIGTAEPLGRLVRDYPDHELAAEASFKRANLLAKAGDVDLAVKEYSEGASRYPTSPFAERAVLAVADTLAAARRDEAAQRAYADFLRRFPESASWAEARKRMTAVWYRRGKNLPLEEKAAIWKRLREAYPLSPYAPLTLLEEAGLRKGGQSLFLLREVIARYPKSPQAPLAALKVATILQQEAGRTPDAVEALQRVIDLFPKSPQATQARRRLQVMQQESLTIRLPAPRATDGPRTLLVETRNIESLKGRFYRIDAVEYFRKHGSLAGLDKVMVEVIAPDGTFEHAVEGYEKFRAIKGEIAIPGLDAGAYIVAVEGGTLRASGLMLVSDLTLITKDSPKGALAFVQEKGRPIGGVTFLARDRKGKVREATSDKEGVAELRFPHSAGSASFLAVHGGSIAHVGAGFSTSAIRGYETRVHISTDRPVYRPGHKVRYRAIVRRASGEFLVTPAGESARITVTDGVGNRLHQLDTKLSEFGTAAGEFELPKDLPPGNRKIVLAYRGRSYSGSFLVEAYRKPQIFLDLVPDRPTFVRGEDVAFEIRARYAFGRPLPGMDLELRAWGTVGKQGSSLLKTTVTTDAEGKARVTIPTHAGPDMRLKITATGIDNTRRRYELQREILVNESAYRASVSVEHDTLFAGETARILLKTFDALGNPVGAEGTIDVGYEVPGSGTSLFPKVASLPVTTGSDGQTRSEYVPGKAGIYLFRFVGVDRAGRKVTANAMVEVVAEDGRVIVRSDVVEYRVGDLARVTVTSPTRDAFALLTFEGEEVYGHRVLRLKQTRNVLEIPIDARFVPDVRIRVALAHNGKLYEGEDQVRVQQRMLLNVRPEKGEYGPGQLCRLFLETTDEAGKALPAEVAVAVVDAAIFLLHPDRAPDLVATFTPPARMDLVQTRSSLDFSYDGVTAAISKDLIEERIRREMKKLEKGLLLEESEMDDAPFEDELGEPSTSIGLGGGAGGGRRGRGGRRNLRAGGGAPGAAAAIDPRRKFEDTAFFAAAIRTGSDGKATVEFTLPDDLTEWRITARGASRANAFGEARSGFLTSRPLVVRSALPRFLREGDELTAAAGIVNGTELQANVLVELTSGLEETLTIAPGDEGVVDWPLPEHEVGLMTLRAKASAEGIGSDIEERKLKVQAYGVDWRTGFAGISTEPGERILHLPHDLAAGTAKLRLQVAPSLAAAALDGIAELRAYPYGCTEQTVNRFYPALEIAAAIKTLGLDKTKLLPGLMKIAQAGALRLTYLQNKEGLWGWWRRGGSDPEMSAYALIALARARKAGVDFSEKTMERARKALPELLKKVRDPDLRAFLLLAQAHAFGADFQQLAPYFADRARLGTRGLAHLALAYEPMGRTSQQKILIEEMGRRRTPPDVETLGWALAAAAGLDSSSALSRDLALRLARHRKGSGFGTTRQTGAAILGLARALEGQGVAPRGMTVNVSINGETVLTEKVPADGRSLSLPVEKLKPGENRVAVTGSGGGTLFYSLLLEGLRKEAPATGGPLTLQRSHALVPSRYSERSAALVKRGGVVREPEVDALRIGELLRVTLTLQSSGQRQLVIEDPLPAGFEPVAGTEKGPFLATHRLDDKMVFFLEAPTEEVAVSYLVQSEAPGRVKAPPAVAYAMYQPALTAYSTEKALQTVGQLDLLNRDPTLGLDAFALLEQARKLATEKRHELAARHIDALLERYELLPEMRLNVSRELARIRAALNDPAGVVKCYEWLLAEDPSTRLTLEDETLRADAFRALDRHGEAITAMEGATRLLFGVERRAPKETGDWSLTEKIFDRYPFAPYLESAWINYAQQRAGRYEAALGRKEEADARDLAVLFEFLARYPQSAAAPQIAFRHMRAHLRAGRFEELEAEARRFGDRWPGDLARDDADWFVVYALFAQDRFDEADAAAKASLSRRYAHKDDRRGPSGYRNNLVHVRAQIAHVQGRLDEAISFYRSVASVSPDAREALAQLTRRKITMPGVVRIGVGETAAVPLTAQNLRGARLQLYPIDLLVYFTLKKDVGKVAGLNLDGLRPAQEKEIAFPKDRLEHTTEIDLGALAAGVYLVIVQSEEKELRGIVVVSDIEATAWLHRAGARVVVRHRKSGEPIVGAFVKVAVGGRLVGQGATDARGVFEVSGGFEGTVSAVAAKEGSFALASR